MSDSIVAEHALNDFLNEQEIVAVENPGVVVTIEPFLSHINLRGNPSDVGFANAVKSVLGQELPKPGQVVRAQHAIYWIGPEEYLLITADRNKGLLSSLKSAFLDLHAAATDLSGGQVLLSVSGASVREFLSKGSTLDLHDSVFEVGACAQSTFAKATGLFALRENTPVFELVIRRSFADYLGKWMHQAGQEFGISFTTLTSANSSS